MITEEKMTAALLFMGFTFTLVIFSPGIQKFTSKSIFKFVFTACTQNGLEVSLITKSTDNICKVVSRLSENRTNYSIKMQLELNFN